MTQSSTPERSPSIPRTPVSEARPYNPEQPPRVGEWVDLSRTALTEVTQEALPVYAATAKAASKKSQSGQGKRSWVWALVALIIVAVLLIGAGAWIQFKQVQSNTPDSVPVSQVGGEGLR